MLVHSGCCSRKPQTWWLKIQQKFISYCSEAWKVQDLGTSRLESGKHSFFMLYPHMEEVVRGLSGAFSFYTCTHLIHSWASLVAQWQRILLPMQETQVWSLGQEDTLEKEEATHSSILDWEIQWTESLAGSSPWGHKRVGHNLGTKHHHQQQSIHKFSTLLSLDGETMETETILGGLQNHCRWWLQPWS